MHVLKKFHKKIFSLTAFIKSLAKTAQKRLFTQRLFTKTVDFLKIAALKAK